jgi:single-strand DNA-binding protein
MAGEVAVTIVGTLCADPEMRFISSGDGVVNFTIASNSRRLNKDTGKWEDSDALFMRCNAWRQLAENINESLSKGDRAIVTGRLKQRSYEIDGQKRTVIELEVDEIGPSLKWATAKVNKATRSGGRATQDDDQWASPAQPAKASAGGDSWDDDPPPFFRSERFDNEF